MHKLCILILRYKHRNTIMKTTFIGHRQVYAKNIYTTLIKTIEEQIQNGCRCFSMGMHGEFDRLALSACRFLRHQYKNIEIEVVITGLHIIEKQDESNYTSYDDVNTVMYEIEDAHFKNRITLSNRMMIDNCDTLICYVDTNAYKSGAKNAMLYARKRGLNIINLYCEEYRPFYGMTKEEILSHINSNFEKLK